MDFQTYQNATDHTAIYPGAGTGSAEAINYCLISLFGEAGGAANKWKKYLRGDVAIEDILPLVVAELGDTLWYLARLSLEMGQPFELIAHDNLQKLDDRKKRGVLQGTGSNR